MRGVYRENRSEPVAIVVDRKLKERLSKVKYRLQYNRNSEVTWNDLLEVLLEKSGLEVKEK